MLVDEQLKTSRHSAPAAHRANFGLHEKQCGSRVREGFAPVLCSGETPPWSAGSSSGAPSMRTWTCQTESRGGQKMIRWLEHQPYEDKPRKLGQFSLEKRRFRGDLRLAFQHSNGPDKKAGEEFFTRTCTGRTSGMVLN